VNLPFTGNGKDDEVHLINNWNYERDVPNR